MPLDDLARARVDHARAVAPPARRAVHPLNRAVARVQRVDGVRPDFDAVAVAEARGLERRRPPPRAVQERAADGLRRARIEVVHDGLLGCAEASGVGRVGALQSVAREQPLARVLADGRGVVGVGEREVARTGLEGARLVAGLGKRDKRVTDANRDGVGVGGDAADFAAGVVAGKRQPRLHFGVARERLEHRRDRRAARLVQREAALARGTKGLRHAVRVAHEEVRHVDEHPFASGARGGVLGRRGKAPRHALGEGVAHGQRLGGVVGCGAVVQVGLHHQHFRPDALEAHQPRAAELAPVQPDVVGAQARRQAVDVEEVLVQRGDLQPDLACARVPVDGKEAVAAVHALGRLGDAR